MMFVSPDTLIPDPYNPLDWNRYLYARANPLRYNDPTGHWPFSPPCIGVGCTSPLRFDPSGHLLGLMMLAYAQTPRAEITGPARYDIANDKTLLQKQDEKVKKLTSDSRYEEEDFIYDFGTENITFGEMGNNNMLEDATQSQTWTVRAARVSTTVSITKAGDIEFNYELTDRLDLEPAWDERPLISENGKICVSCFFYNIATEFTGGVWHGLLGAKKMETSAHWEANVKGKEVKTR